MKYFSMFSGIGGFELGIKQAYEKFRLQRDRSTRPQHGGSREGLLFSGSMSSGKEPSLTCVGYSEINKYAIQIYKKHFPKHKNYGDATKINPKELPDFDLLVGGFPCQSFSIAGKRGGFKDTRGTLFFEIGRVAREKLPRTLLLENVKGLLNHSNGETFRTVIKTLDELGYDAEWQVLNSKYHGVPQNRERVFIIGHLMGEPRQQIFPIKKGKEVNTKQDEQGNDIAHTIQPGDKHRGSYVKTGDFRNDEGLRIREEDISPCLAKRKHSETDPSTMPPFILESDIRRLTPIECERLQGFPDGWTEKGVDEDGNDVEISDTQRYKVLGNAVTVNVIKDIITKL